MTQRVEGKQKRALETRSKIMAAYEKLAAVKAFDAISIDEIARAAGVGKGTVLAHFSEKIALPAMLFAREIDRLAQQVARAEVQDFDLKTALLGILNFTFTDDVYARLILWEGQEICTSIIEPEEIKFFAAIGQHLVGEGQEIDIQIDLIRALLVNATVMQRYCKNRDEALEQFMQLYNRYIAN